MGNHALTLGDAGNDEWYDGEQSTSPVSMDYARSRYLEFQAVMNALDSTYNAMNALYFSVEPDPEIYDWLMDYESKAGQIRVLAQTLNAGAATINALGGRMLSLSIPATLGALPLVIGGALALALASVGAWIAYARGKVAGADAIIEKIESMPDNATKPEILTAANTVRQSMASISDNALSRLVGQIGDLGGFAKLAFFGVIGFVAYRFVKKLS